MNRRNRIRSRSDVETHNTGGCSGPYYPALNVRAWPDNGVVDAVVEKFKCSNDQVHKAVEMAFDSSREMFWEEIEDTAKECLGSGIKVYSAGRCGGWLIVQGLPPTDTWDAIQLGKWRKFAGWVDKEIEYRCSKEPILEDIEANQWWKDGSERYNFVDMENGETKCIADMKKEAIEAGFGPVVKQ